jgi:hypothetical protein
MVELPRISREIRGRSGAVRAIAGDQAGVVARALRSGRLHRLHKGVYSTQAPELATEDALLIAALMAAGDGAVLSHGTAAWRWQIIPAPPTRIELAVPRDRISPAGLVLHDSRLRPGDLLLDARFPRTSVPRTLLDVAARYDQRALLRALAEAEFHHDTRPADIQATLRRGHPGSANLRAALKAHTPGHGEMKSQLERRFRILLIEHRIDVAHPPRRGRARRPPAHPPPPGRQRRRPRPVATPQPLHPPPLRHQADPNQPRRRHRRPPGRLRRSGQARLRRLSRRRRPTQAVVRLGQTPDALVDLLRRDA